MSLDRELERTHRDLSGLDLEFRRAAVRDPALQDRSTFSVLDSGNRLLTFRLQSWPTFVGPSKLDEIRRLSVALNRLLKSVPQKVFCNDPVQVCQFYGLESPAVAELLFLEPNGIDGALSRGDLLDTQDGFKCIEFNMGANLGGWETGILAEMLLSVPAVANFLDQRGAEVFYTDTVRVLFSHVVDEARRKCIADRVVNIAISADITDPERARMFEQYLNREYRSFQEELEVEGVVLLYSGGGCSLRGGVLHRNDLPIHAILEFESIERPAEVFHAFKSGSLLLYDGPASDVITSKRNIALASENQEADCFSFEERELIRRHIPWSALLLPRQATYGGEAVFLPDLVAAHRGRFVLKDSLSAGGKGVHLGRFTPEAEWSRLLETALAEGTWLVQEFLQSRPYLCQNGPSGCSPHNVVWGPFVFGDQYAGTILRMQPVADEGAVNLSRTATEGIVFEVDEN